MSTAAQSIAIGGGDPLTTPKEQVNNEAPTTTTATAASSDAPKAKQIILPWDRFSNWVSAILVVTFDIEMGQSLEAIYPSPIITSSSSSTGIASSAAGAVQHHNAAAANAAFHVKLTSSEKNNICYLSFPDSNSGFLGDIQYHFRIKHDAKMKGSGGIAGLSHHHVPHYLSNLNNSVFEEYNRKSPPGLEVDKEHLFGYVYFRQVKDKSLKRGYFQKSVVLLSKFPYISLFNYILSLIANEYFSTGPEILETACHNIDHWPFPIPGDLLSLPILGNLIEIILPLSIDKYTLPVIYKRECPGVPANLPPPHEINLYTYLKPILHHIHLLWELILLNEPIVVIAAVPNVCSETVQALISIVWPLKYASDYRPYFTIHNSEFPEYSSKVSSPPGLVVGVTNPFFTKCFQHWPHIIKVTEVTNKPDNKMLNKDILNNNNSNNSKIAKIKKTGNLRVIDNKPAVYSKYEPFLNKDKNLLKNLNKGADNNRPAEAQATILRRYFIELTQSFIIPLERYFSTLMPLQKNISPFKSPPKLKEFDVEEFMRNLKLTGPEAPPNLNGDCAGLYRKFFDTLNFKYWYKQKIQEAEKKLELLQLQSLFDYDVSKWLQGKQEIEIIDQFLHLKKKLELIEDAKIEATEDIKAKIKSILNLFLQALPDDVRSILHK